MAIENGAANDRNTNLTWVLSALGRRDPDVSTVVTAMAENDSDDVWQVASALVCGDKTQNVSPADFTRVAPIVAYCKEINQPEPGTDGARLFARLSGDEVILGKLSKAASEAIRLSSFDFLRSKQKSVGFFLLRFSKPGALQVKLRKAAVLQLSLRETDILQLSETDILQLHLRETDILQLHLSETDILQVHSNGDLVLRLRLRETDILQLQVIESGTVQQQLNETDILQLSETDILQLSETDILQLSKVDISQLSETDILQVTLNETDILQMKLREADILQVQLSDIDVFRMKRRERFVSSALKVLEECWPTADNPTISSQPQSVAQLLATFTVSKRDDYLLALLTALEEFLPALERVRQSEVLRAMERLAQQRLETMVALARLANERPALLRALVDLGGSGSCGGAGGDGSALMGNQPESDPLIDTNSSTTN